MVINRGIGGDTTEYLEKRWEADCLQLKPKVAIVMIGVNDTWHHAADCSWIPNDVFEERYRTVLSAIKTRTHAKIMMIEPYIVPAEDKMFFYQDLFPKILVERKLAREFADVYMPLDGLLAQLAIDRPYSDFSDDGVHPNASGAQIIGKLYADYIAPLIK